MLNTKPHKIMSKNEVTIASLKNQIERLSRQLWNREFEEIHTNSFKSALRVNGDFIPYCILVGTNDAIIKYFPNDHGKHKLLGFGNFVYHEAITQLHTDSEEAEILLLERV